MATQRVKCELAGRSAPNATGRRPLHPPLQSALNRPTVRVCPRCGTKATLPRLVPASTPTLTPPGVIPLEGDAGSWLAAVRSTLVGLLLRPSASFAVCPEPIRHGRVLAFMATLRLPLWIVLVVQVAATHMTATVPAPAPMRSIYQFVDPALAQALSTWLVLMVPVGVPLLYFLAGLVAHIGVALTGGAPRSIGASMRAVGYALGPALLVIAGLDVPLYLGHIDAQLYLGIVGATAVAFLWLAAFGLARTHRVSLARGFLVGLLPMLVFAAVTGGRASLELTVLPGFEAPESPYYVP